MVGPIDGLLGVCAKQSQFGTAERMLTAVERNGHEDRGRLFGRAKQSQFGPARPWPLLVEMAGRIGRLRAMGTKQSQLVTDQRKANSCFGKEL